MVKKRKTLSLLMCFILISLGFSMVLASENPENRLTDDMNSSSVKDNSNTPMLQNIDQQQKRDGTDTYTPQAYDEYGSDSVDDGFYGGWYFTSVTGWIMLWVQTDVNYHGLDLMLMDETNFNNFDNGFSYTTLDAKYNMHVASVSYYSTFSQTIYCIWENDDEGVTVYFDYFIDLGADDYPSFSGHTFQENSIILEPTEYYYITASNYGPESMFSGYFENYMPTQDHIDFFICDSSGFAYWETYNSIPVDAFYVNYNYYWMSWWDFIPTHMDTWYFVHSAYDAEDTVTFSVYMDIEAAPNSITMIAPNSSSVWYLGQTFNIEWTTSGTIDYVDILLAQTTSDNIIGYMEYSSPNDGVFSWNILDTLDPASDYMVVIQDSSDAGTYAVSEMFTLAPAKTLTITSPNMSSSWNTGYVYDITWEWTGEIDNVTLGIFKDEDLIQAIYDIENDGLYEWFIPYNFTSGSDYWVLIYDYTMEAADDSDYFTITQTDVSITITTPDDDTEWMAGTTNLIEWESTGPIAEVDIWICSGTYEDFEILGYIALNAPNSGSYSWGIPSDMTPSTEYFLIISSSLDFSLIGLSGIFEIVEMPTSGAIYFTSPTPVSNWNAGGTYFISFNYIGGLGDVKIELHKDGSFYRTITSSTDGSEQYEWTIPDDIPTSDSYQIKVICLDDSDLWGISDEFTISELEDDPTDGDDNGKIPGFMFVYTSLAIYTFVVLRRNRRTNSITREMRK